MNTKFFLPIISSAFLLLGCESEDPIPLNQEELITTLIFELTPTSGGEVVIFKFVDPDGQGGLPPEITTGKLNALASYTGKVTLLNESTTPPDNITNEISKEAEEHQFFYQSSTPFLIITYNDLDGNGFPIGIQTLVETGESGTINLTITLRHEPYKEGEGVKQGEIQNAGGETDIEVTFEVPVE